MKNFYRQNPFKLAGIMFLVMAAGCGLFTGMGLLWLRIEGFPADAMIPKPLMTALLCTFVYGVFGLVTLAFSTRPPGGGLRRKTKPKRTLMRSTFMRSPV